jgi:hypothetical protein
MTPLTPSETAGITWTLVFYAIVIGVVLIAGIAEYLKRTSASASSGYIPVTVVPGAAAGVPGSYAGSSVGVASYPSSDPYSSHGFNPNTYGAPPGLGVGGYGGRPQISSAWRGAEPLDFDKIPDPKQFQRPARAMQPALAW